MWVQKPLLSHKWFLSDSAFILDVPEGIWINIMRMFMNHLIIILEISVLNNTLGFIIKLHDWAFLFNKIYLTHIVLFAFIFLYVSYIFSLEFEKKRSISKILSIIMSSKISGNYRFPIFSSALCTEHVHHILL